MWTHLPLRIIEYPLYLAGLVSYHKAVASNTKPVLGSGEAMPSHISSTTFRLIATVRYRENLAAHTWNRVGICPEEWRVQGSHEVILMEFQGFDELLKIEDINGLVTPFFQQIDLKTDYVDFQVVHWRVYFPGELTPLEHLRDELLKNPDLPLSVEEITKRYTPQLFQLRTHH